MIRAIIQLPVVANQFGPPDGQRWPSLAFSDQLLLSMAFVPPTSSQICSNFKHLVTKLNFLASEAYYDFTVFL